MALQKSNTLKLQAARVGSSLKVSFSDFSWQLAKDEVEIILLFLLAVFSVYFLGRGISQLVFLGFLAAFWFSKKDYLWFALYFVFVLTPGYFLQSMGPLVQYRIPVYSVASGISFSATDIFVILALGKALIKGRRVRLRLEKPLLIILIYICISFVFSYIKGANVSTLANLVRGPFFYSVIISFLFLVRNRKQAYSFILLVSSFVFFILFTQLFYLVTHNEFINLFFPGFRGTVLIEGTQEIRPIMGGVLLVLFSFVYSLLLAENREVRISQKYLYLIAGTAFFSVVLSATRIWFAVFLFLILGYILISKKQLSNLAVASFAMGFFVVALLMVGIIPFEMITGVLERLSGLAAVARGDFHSVSTFEYRYYHRLPLLMVGLRENVLFGCGFSETYFQYRDYHVGFFNTILQFGVVGFSFFLYFFIRYFYILISKIKKISRRNPLRGSLKMLPVIFSGVLLAHFTTWYFIQFSTDTRPPFFIAIFIALTELFLRESENVEKSLRVRGKA